MTRYLTVSILVSALLLTVSVRAQEAGEDPAAGEQAGAEAATGSGETQAPAPIYLAARDGRIDKVRSLIASGADINAVNAYGRSALMSAVYLRNRKIVRELLVEGADVNTVDAQGKTALILATAKEDMDIVQMLIDAGADVTIEDKTKNTALTIAEKRKNKPLTKLLESAGE